MTAFRHLGLSDLVNVVLDLLVRARAAVRLVDERHLLVEAVHLVRSVSLVIPRDVVGRTRQPEICGRFFQGRVGFGGCGAEVGADQLEERFLLLVVVPIQEILDTLRAAAEA